MNNGGYNFFLRKKDCFQNETCKNLRNYNNGIEHLNHLKRLIYSKWIFPPKKQMGLKRFYIAKKNVVFLPLFFSKVPGEKKRGKACEIDKALNSRMPLMYNLSSPFMGDSHQVLL